jgi:hypothetical protein
MRNRVLAVLCLLALALVYRWLRSPGADQQEPSHSATFTSTTAPAQTEKAAPEQSGAAQVKTYTKAVASPLAKPMVARRSPHGPAGVSFSKQQFPSVKVGPAVTINSQTQTVLGARAVATPQYDRSFGPVLFEQSGYSVVSLNTVAEPGWDDLIMHAKDRPVVSDANGRVGIVTGTLIVKLDDIHLADKIAGRENFQLLGLDEAIGVAYFRVPENYRVLSGAQKLAQSAGVLRVEIEIVQGRKVLQ